MRKPESKVEEEEKNGETPMANNNSRKPKKTETWVFAFGGFVEVFSAWFCHGCVWLWFYRGVLFVFGLLEVCCVHDGSTFVLGFVVCCPGELAEITSLSVFPY